jgi:hypothetical protein
LLWTTRSHKRVASMTQVLLRGFTTRRTYETTNIMTGTRSESNGTHPLPGHAEPSF